jgi:hypothetical protein
MLSTKSSFLFECSGCFERRKKAACHEQLAACNGHAKTVAGKPPA